MKRALAALALALALPGVAAAQLAVGGYELLGQTRVTRTVSDFRYRATVTNAGAAPALDVTATLIGVPAGATIVEGELSFGEVAAGAALASSDDFTLRIDRRVPFSAAGLVWDVAAAPANTAPVANAGPDQTAQVTTTVFLDASGSSDADGDPLAFAWTLVSRPAGSAAELSDEQAVDPSFVVDRAGEYEVALEVDDGRGGTSSDSVVVSTTNSAPVANAGADQTLAVGETVVLDGGGSTDVDGDALSYHWVLRARPAGSAAALSDANAVNPSFVVDAGGQYLVELVVNDGLLDSPADAVAIDTRDSAPVADAGADQLVFLGTTAELRGDGSSDVDGDPLTFSWSFVARPDGSAATLSDAGAIRPTFQVDRDGSYVAQLIVNDGILSSAPDTVTLTTVNRSPEANAGPDQSVALGATVQLDGSGSSDPDPESLAFRWSLTSTPGGSGAALSDPNALAPSFVADLPGVYIAQLVVSDGKTDSLPDTVRISTANSAPIARAGGDRTVAAGATVVLNGGASEDPDGTPLEYAWSLTSVPAGSAAVLANPGTVTPSFVADLPGEYLAQLVVGDGELVSAPDTVLVSAVENVVTVQATDDVANEAGPDTATFTVTRAGFTTEPLSVSLSILGTATNGVDYETIASEVTIPAGAAAVDFVVTPIDDTLPEGPEGVLILVAAGAGYTVGLPGIDTATIGDDDRVLSVVADDPSATELGTTTGSFTFTRTGPTSEPLTFFVDWGGSASEGFQADYQPLPQALSFAAGQDSLTLVVTPFIDNLAEGDETVVATLLPNTAFAIAPPGSATVTIADDPPVVNAAATDAAAAELGLDPGTFTFTRSGGNPAAALTVRWSLSGTAANSADYVFTGGSLEIPANLSSATLTITPRIDNAVEGAETVVLTLNANPSYVIGAQSTATIAIADDPPTVTIVATDPDAAEAGPDTGTLTITRTGGNPAAAMNVFLTRTGSAAPADYTGIATFATFAANQTSVVLTLTPVQDTLVEGPHEAVIGLSPSPNYVIGTPASATVTIADDD